jgi:hypothetical protein
MLRLCTAVTVTTLLSCTAADAGENPANHGPGQQRVGPPPTFVATGPATQSPTNNKKDGMLTAVITDQAQISLSATND